MMKKIILLFVLYFFVNGTKANMASPFQEGTKVGSPFGSSAISITKEQIFIKIDSSFNSAKFIVTYYINTAFDGTQIPLLFVALDYEKDFKVWVDDRLVIVQNLPENYIRQNPIFNNFKNIYSEQEKDSDRIKIYWDKDEYDDYLFKDLKYFETSLNKGIHKIRVEYTANAWRDKSGYSIKKSFRYSLTPAKYWKDFGSLEVEVEQADADKIYEINFESKPTSQTSKNKIWSFTKLPAEFIKIQYQKPVPAAPAYLINTDPFYLMIIFGLLIFTLNGWLVYRFRKNHKQKGVNHFVWVGAIIASFLILVSYSFFYFFIDYLIGPEASGHGGYSILILIFYPVLLLFYWGSLALFDLYLKRKWKLVN
jgi:hypothetical protein